MYSSKLTMAPFKYHMENAASVSVNDIKRTKSSSISEKLLRTVIKTELPQTREAQQTGSHPEFIV